MSYPKLKNPPILESIISVRFAEEVGLKDIQAFAANETIKSKYGVVASDFRVNVSIGPEAVSEEAIKTAHSQTGLLLKNQQEKPDRVVRMNVDSLSVHILRGYTDFEYFLATFEEVWDILIHLVTIPAINLISLRYINALSIKPLPELVKLNIITPFEGDTSNFFLQTHVKTSQDDQVSIIITETTQSGRGTEPSKFFLDIHVQKNVELSSSKSIIWKNLSVLRSVKNEMFFSILTDQALAPYL